MLQFDRSFRERNKAGDSLSIPGLVINQRRQKLHILRLQCGRVFLVRSEHDSLNALLGNLWELVTQNPGREDIQRAMNGDDSELTI